jgi:hypothetical protein
MKNLKYLLIPVICIGIASCSRQGKKETANSIEEHNHVQTGPFNLATLAVGQNINDILKSAGVTIKDTVHTDDITLIGNDRLAFFFHKNIAYGWNGPGWEKQYQYQ